LDVFSCLQVEESKFWVLFFHASQLKNPS
jgi:hypothetical protein